MASRLIAPATSAAPTSWIASEACGAGTGGRRALDLLHIDVNRLGLNPAEECIAGLCARQLLTGGAVPPAQPSAAVG